MAKNIALGFSLEVDDKGSLKINKFEKNLKNMGDAGEKMGKKFKSASQSMGGIAKGFSSIGSVLGKVAISAGLALAAIDALISAFVTGVIIKSADEFEAYETALNDMAKVTNQSLSSIDAAITGLDAKLGSSTQMVEGLYQVISAGFGKPAEAMEILKTSAEFAHTAHMGLEDVVKGVTKVMINYSDELKNASDAADLLQTIEKTGQTTVQELIPVIGELSALSHTAGMSANEMGAALATVTTVSAGAADAQTKLSSLIRAVTSASKENAMSIWGTATGMEAIQKLGFGGTIKEIGRHFGSNTEALQKFLGREEAWIASIAITQGGMEKYNSALGEMGNKYGAAAKASEKYKKSLAGLKEAFANTMKSIRLDIGKVFGPVFKGAFTLAAALLEENRQYFIDWAKDVRQSLVENADEIGVMVDMFLKGFGMVIEVLEVVSEAFVFFAKLLIENREGVVKFAEGLSIVVKALAGFAAVVLTGWAELGTAMAMLYTWFEEKIPGAIEKSKEAIQRFVGMSKEAFQEISNQIEKVGEKIKSLFTAGFKTGEGVGEYIIKFFGEGSTKKPITEKMDEIEGKMEKWREAIIEKPAEVVVAIVGDNGEQKLPISETLKKVGDETFRFYSDMEGIEPELSMKILADDGIEKKPVTDAVDKIMGEVKGLEEAAEGISPEVLMNFRMTDGTGEKKSPGEAIADMLKNLDKFESKDVEATAKVNRQNFDKFLNDVAAAEPVVEVKAELDADSVNDINREITNSGLWESLEVDTNFISNNKPISEQFKSLLDQFGGMSKENKVKLIAEIDTSTATKTWEKAIQEYRQMMASTDGDLARMGRRMLAWATGQMQQLIRNMASDLEATSASKAAQDSTAGGSTTGYASGTGAQGLPETGLFRGHVGEIILNQKDSQAVRQGASVSTNNTTNNNTTGGDVHIHVQTEVGDEAGMQRTAKLLWQAMRDHGNRTGQSIPGLSFERAAA